jgi:hypothetical protein
VPFADIAHSALVTFRFKQTFDGEDWQFGIKTEKRDSADWETLLTAALGWASSGDLVLERTTLTGITYSEWETSGFTGYHQVFSILASHSFSSGNQLPPQCAVVVSLLNTDTPGVSVKRRRGRIYIGQIPTAFVDGDGVLLSSSQVSYRGAMDSLQTALEGVPSGSPDPAVLDGICIASEAEGSIFSADVCGVGAAVDTQRRRRRKRLEGIVYTAL